MNKIIVIFFIFVFWVVVPNLYSDDREGSAETFLSRGEGHWVSPRRVRGEVLIFVFKGDTYCAAMTGDPLNKSCGHYEVYSNEGGYYIKLMEQSGKVMMMSLEVKNEYTVFINKRELKREK